MRLSLAIVALANHPLQIFLNTHHFLITCLLLSLLTPLTLFSFSLEALAHFLFCSIRPLHGTEFLKRQTFSEKSSLVESGSNLFLRDGRRRSGGCRCSLDLGGITLDGHRRLLDSDGSNNRKHWCCSFLGSIFLVKDCKRRTMHGRGNGSASSRSVLWQRCTRPLLRNILVFLYGLAFRSVVDPLSARNSTGTLWLHLLHVFSVIHGQSWAAQLLRATQRLHFELSGPCAR